VRLLGAPECALYCPSHRVDIAVSVTWLYCRNKLNIYLHEAKEIMHRNASRCRRYDAAWGFRCRRNDQI